MSFTKITEQPSHYNDLEKKSINEILTGINQEDHKVAAAVKRTLPEIEKLVEGIVDRMQRGEGFYIGRVAPVGCTGRIQIPHVWDA